MIEYFPFVLSLSKHEFSFFSTLLGVKKISLHSILYHGSLG